MTPGTVIVTIKIEVPKDLYATLDETYWLRLTQAIETIMRIPMGREPILKSGSVWTVLPCPN